MLTRHINQINPRKAAKALSKYNDTKLSASAINSIIAEVNHKGRVSSWEIGMIYGSTNGLFDSGVLKEEGGYIVKAVTLC